MTHIAPLLATAKDKGRQEEPMEVGAVAAGPPPLPGEGKHSRPATNVVPAPSMTNPAMLSNLTRLLQSYKSFLGQQERTTRKLEKFLEARTMPPAPTPVAAAPCSPTLSSTLQCRAG